MKIWCGCPAPKMTINSSIVDSFLYRKGTAAHSQAMLGSEVHRRTDKANLQLAPRRVQGQALFEGASEEV